MKFNRCLVAKSGMIPQPKMEISKLNEAIGSQ